jgi:hypothetical protein
VFEASPSQHAAQAAIVADAQRASGRVTAASVSALRWIPAIVVAMAYPFALRGFIAAVHAAQTDVGVQRALWSLGVLAALALILAAPALSLRVLYAIRSDTSPGMLAVRWLMHLGVAVPPFYLLTIRVADFGALVGGTASGLIAWWSLWIVLSVLVWNAGRTAEHAPTEAAGVIPARVRPTTAGRLRMIHRIAAVAVLATFLVAHLVNHVFAIWSIPAQQTAMLALRTWYRAIWIEPVILALFGIAALAGLLRLARLTRSQHDGFRVLQTASGCYLVFFLMSHVWATLGARYQGIDTNWAFASGGRGGLLASDIAAGILVYYVGSLLAVAVHAALGLRMVLLSHRVRAVAANRSATFVFAFGITLSALIVAALLGVRLGG